MRLSFSASDKTIKFGEKFDPLKFSEILLDLNPKPDYNKTIRYRIILNI